MNDVNLIFIETLLPVGTGTGTETGDMIKRHPTGRRVTTQHSARLHIGRGVGIRLLRGDRDLDILLGYGVLGGVGDLHCGLSCWRDDESLIPPTIDRRALCSRPAAGKRRSSRRRSSYMREFALLKLYRGE